MIIFDRVKRHRFRRGTIISVAIVLGFCSLSGIFAFAILMGSGRLPNFLKHRAQVSISSQPGLAPRPQEGTRPAETGSEIGSIVPDQVASPAPVIQSAPIIPAMRVEQIPNQTEMSLFPKTSGSNQASFSQVPLPIARPNRRVIEQMRKTAKSEMLNKTNKNINEIDKRDSPLNQAKDTNRHVKTIVHESETSEIDARKIAALELERSYVNAGIAISTHVSGLNGTVLNIEYPQFNDALVQKILSVHSFAATLGKVGFTQIIFKAAQDKIWAFPLQPPSQAGTALQEPASANK